MSTGRHTDGCIPIGFLISEEKKPVCVSCKQEHLVIIYYPLYILAAFYFGPIFHLHKSCKIRKRNSCIPFPQIQQQFFLFVLFAGSVFTHLYRQSCIYICVCVYHISVHSGFLLFAVVIFYNSGRSTELVTMEYLILEKYRIIFL